jgi:uncharacterized protein YqeY
MSVSLWDRIIADLTAAMKARDQLRTSVLRGLKSDLKYREIELGRPLTDEDCVSVFHSAAKKRKDAIDAFKKGGRADRAQLEETELAQIKEYLPAELSDKELMILIGEVAADLEAEGPKDFGKVMKATMVKVAGRADGKRVSAAVSGHLKK